MASIVDLSNYENVKANKDAIKFVLSLPVSRELSRDEQALILHWIELGAPA
jgi:hypothetical protein